MLNSSRSLILALLMGMAGAAAACNIEYSIELNTFGEGVQVELRAGTPGSSRVVRTSRSSGGAVVFSPLCADTYFLAIGNDDSVSVTQPRYFQEDRRYTSRITVQRGGGNVTRSSRKSL